MNKCRGTLFRAIATRAVIAVIPAAMVSAYASGIFVAPPRMAAYEYVQVAEITNTPNTIGMAESPLYGMSQADINATLDQLQSIGVQNIRVFVPWGLIEQTEGSPNFSLLDMVMSAAAARNMGVMAEVNATPSWAAVPGSSNFPPGSAEPNVTKFTNFMQEFMAHQMTVNGPTYADIVSAYEIWNEPNYFVFSNPISPEAYATLLKAAYEVINRDCTHISGCTSDPTATVVAGAVGATQTFPPPGGGITLDPVTFVTRMLAALGPNALDYFDALSIHPYGTTSYTTPCPTCSSGILTPKQQVEAIMGMIGTKQVWLSEYGVSSTDPATAAVQATWIKDLLDTWQTYDQAGPVFLYTARDTAGSTDSGATLGIWTSVGGEKVYVDGNGVSHTVSEMLKDWIAAHPMPTNPGIPGIPILNPIAALVQALVSGVQAFVTAVVTAITNFLGGIAGVLSGPAAAGAAPLALRSASVASADTGGLAAESDATTADGKAAATTEKTATEETATEKTATEVTAAEETATAETPATETAALPAVAATETAAATATETAVPVKVTEPVTPTEPVKTEPVKTEPTGTTGTATEASSTGTSTGSTTPDSSAGSKSDESGKPSDSDKSGESTKSGSSKSGESTKSGGSEGQSKSGKDGNEGSGSRTRGKDGSGSGEVKAKPVTVTAGVGAAGAEGGEGASDSAGGAAS
jgi:hypothetical protein